MNKIEVNHRTRAMRFHRRAQFAEARWAAADRIAALWVEAYVSMRANRDTLKRKLKRVRAQLRNAAPTSSLQRIIALGRQYP
jgi:U3 small nucleolar RNA-associated protein 14